MTATALPTGLAALRDELAALPPPVVVFNKSHSGSRLVARLLEAAGMFMGEGLNESHDAVVLLPLVHAAVDGFYPDYGPVWRNETAATGLAKIARAALGAHLVDRHDRPWGWKLCETVYALPVINYLFPNARYVHVIRDGRDVAFSDHVHPKEPFWQKAYVDTVGVKRWRGLFFGRHSGTAYRVDSSLYNVQHWVNSVTLGRRYGAMLGHRYLEVRYEALCTDFDNEARRLLAFASVPRPDQAIAAIRPDVRLDAIGKYRTKSRWRVRRVERFARPLLIELGYLEAN